MALQTEIRDGQTVRYWKPFSTQEDFIQVPDSVEERFFGGMVGGGKTDILIYFPVVRGWYQNPNFRGIIFRKSYPQLEKSIIPRANEIYKALGAKYNAAKHYWEFSSGAIIYAAHLDKNKDAEEHDTNEYHYIGFDELTHFEEWPYIYMMSRCRSTDSSLPAIIVSASNPGNIGHSWVKKRFIDPDKDGHVIIYDARTGTKRIYIPSSIRDNKYLMENDPGYLNKLANLPEKERRAKLEGDWEAFQGQVFEEFREKPDPFIDDKRTHVCKTFDIPIYWPRFVAIDWGYIHPTVIHWFALSPSGQVYLYRERVYYKQKVASWAIDFSILSQNEDIQWIKMDPSAWQQRGTEQTIAEEFQKFSGFTPMKADNDRIGGKMLIHEYMRMEQKPSLKMPLKDFNIDMAQKVLRQSGQQAYETYLDLFTPPKPEENLPRLQIFNTATLLIETIPMCMYDEDKDGIRAEDVKKWDAKESSDGSMSTGDDAYDCLRYGLKGIEKFLDESKQGESSAIERAKLYEQLTATSNYTAFNRQMEKLEKSESDGIVFSFVRGQAGRNRRRY